MAAMILLPAAGCSSLVATIDRLSRRGGSRASAGTERSAR